MNWGVKIFISFIVFGILMGILVTISFNQEINLVADDYYKQEIEYEAQMDKLRNTASLSNKPTLNYDADTGVLQINFPAELVSEFQSGEVHLFRPSDYKMDKKVRILLDENGNQSFDLNSLEKGLWEAKMTWKSGSREFYEEKKIVI